MVPPYNAGDMDIVTAITGASGVDTISGYSITSVSYTLDTSSGTANVSGVSFSIAPTSGGSAPTTVKARLTSTGTYGSTGSYSWDIVIADSAAAGSADNVVNFTATSN